MFTHAFALLHLLWVVPVATLLILHSRNRRRRILAAFYADPEQAARAEHTVSMSARWVRAIVMIMAMAIIVIGIAGPRWGTENRRITKSGCDAFILLDLSKSMLARDSKPDRLTLAKSLVDELLTALPESRYGVIAFSGKAYSAVPLTSSLDGVRMILDDLDPMMQPYGGSNLEAALKELLKRRKVAESAFVPVIVFSDGEEVNGVAKTLIPKLKRAGFTFFTVGIGDPAVKTRIQLPDDSFVTYRDTPVKTGLVPSTLQALATETSGRYLHADSEPLVVEKITNAIRNEMDGGLRTESSTRPVERFQWALVAAILLLTLRLCMGERRVVTPALALTIACLTLNGFGETEDPRIAQIRAAIDTETDVDVRARHQFSLAKTLQELDKSDDAEAEYKKLLLTMGASASIRSSAMQNLGVIHHRSGDGAFTDDPKTAITAFAKAARFHRAALGLRYDAELVKNLELANTRLIQAEARFRELEERRKRKETAIRQLTSARDNRSRANAQPSSDDDNERALNETEAGGKTATPLAIPKLNETIAAAVDRQRRIREISTMDTRRNLGVDALAKIVEALRLLGVQDPKTSKNPPKPGDAKNPKGRRKPAPNDLPEGLKILKELAERERKARQELKEDDGDHERVGRGEEKDW